MTACDDFSATYSLRGHYIYKDIWILFCRQNISLSRKGRQYDQPIIYEDTQYHHFMVTVMEVKLKLKSLSNVLPIQYMIQPP